MMGQDAGLIKEIKTVKEVLENLVNDCKLEYKNINKKLNDLEI